MKKVSCRLKGLILAGVCVLALASCGGKKEGNSQETDGTAGGISPTPTGEERGFSQKLSEDGAVGDGLALKGKAFGELPVVGKEDAVYCNLPENVVNWENTVPLCVDPLYGIMYYVDYGGDFMIHAVYDGQSQTVVELPGKRLFCRGGKLYFLLQSYNKFKIEGALSGNIAEYDPVTGNVSVLSDKVFDSMVVYQDMIYCLQVGQTTDFEENMKIDGTRTWFYFFDSKTFVEHEISGQVEYVLDINRYGEYFLARTLEPLQEKPDSSRQVGMELRTWDGVRGTVWEGLLTSHEYYVKDDSLHWYSGDSFHIFDMKTGDEQIYSLEKGISNYIVVDGCVYGTANWLFEFENGKTGAWSSMDKRLNHIFEIYTDGEEVYAIAGHYSNDMNPVLRRIQMTEGVKRYSAVEGGMVTEIGFSFVPVAK